VQRKKLPCIRKNSLKYFVKRINIFTFAVAKKEALEDPCSVFAGKNVFAMDWG